MLNRFFNFQTKTITSAAFILFFSALFSRILGLLRDGLLAGYFGGGRELDIYFAAFRIPDFIYNLLIGGGIAVAFLPIFAQYYSREKKEAWKITNLLLNFFLLLIVLLALICFIFAPLLAKLIAPGFSQFDRELLIRLTRLMLLSPLFFGAANLFSGVLQYFNRFLVFAIAPILYNLGIILGIVFLSNSFGIFGVGFGVVGGAFLYFLVQFIGAMLCGFSWRPIFDFKNQVIKKIIYLMVPRTMAVAAQQINLIVITAIASTLRVGSVAIFNFANNIQHIPIGLIGIPFALAAFPSLSKSISQNNHKDFFKDFSSTFSKILFFAVPSSVLIFLLRAQLIRLILGSLGSGRFDWTATKLTAASLGAFAFGIFASALIPLIARAFFANQNTKTPAIISFVSVGLNIALSFIFVWQIRVNPYFKLIIEKVFDLEGMKDIAVVGLPLAFSLTCIFQLICLLVFLYKRIGDFGIANLKIAFKKVVIATLAMSFVTYFVLQISAYLFNTRTVFGLLFQTIITGIFAVVSYLFFAYLLKFPGIKKIFILRNYL
jgi:putative peptidoglycan lipid II flippase